MEVKTVRWTVPFLIICTSNCKVTKSDYYQVKMFRFKFFTHNFNHNIDLKAQVHNIANWGNYSVKVIKMIQKAHYVLGDTANIEPTEG